MENIRKFTKNRILFVICTIMLAAVCIAPFGFKPHNAYAACSHIWRDEKIMRQATCNAYGSKQQYCSRCYARRTISLPKKNHIKSSYFTTIQNPTCGSPGKKVKKCTLCYAYLETQIIPATGNHNWRDSKVFQRPTCTINGSIQQQCSGCYQTRMTYPSKQGHQTNGSYTVTKQATCTEKGRRVLKCTRSGCNDVLNAQDIPALGHNKATRTRYGFTEEYCKRCGDVFSSPVVKLREAYKKDPTFDIDKFGDALWYLNQVKGFDISDEKCAKYELIAKIADLGNLIGENETLQQSAALCEFINFTNDLKNVFGSETGNIERFNSTLDALSEVCSKVPGGEYTLSKLLDKMNEYCTPVLKKVEDTYNVRDLSILKLDEGNSPKIDGSNQLIIDMSLTDIVNNYEAVIDKLKLHYAGVVSKSEGPVNYETLTKSQKKVVDGRVCNFLSAKIEQCESGKSYEKYTEELRHSLS